MAAPKKLVRLAGDDVNLKTGNNPAQQPNPMAAPSRSTSCRTVNELITRFNAHTHVENGTVRAERRRPPRRPPASSSGADVAATNLFVPAAA
jgi:hypothetical protein